MDRAELPVVIMSPLQEQQNSVTMHDIAVICQPLIKIDELSGKKK